MGETHTAEAGDRVVVPIVRDSTFVRFAADEAIYTSIGRDMEVAFLQYGPLYNHAVDRGDTEEFDSEYVRTEVARLRIGMAEMLGVAMNFLRTGVVSGRLNGEAIRTTLDEWIEQAQVRSDEVGKDDE